MSMNFDLTEEQLQIKRAVREFAEAEIRPNVMKWDEAQYFPKEIWRQRANEAGLVFDRFRIIDYLPNEINNELFINIKSWCLSAENLYSH